MRADRETRFTGAPSARDSTKRRMIVFTIAASRCRGTVRRPLRAIEEHSVIIEHIAHGHDQARSS